ncbi:CD1845 family protein [Intestinimonas butyriciproducens]|uniref:CD1845 family protein n=1 Tax=Intestinimonas butyriciproducens TaxID=1297617 RepID=UPI003AEF1F44
MRIILKILAAPFVLVLTLLVAVLSFLLSLSVGILSIGASLLGLLGVLMMAVERDFYTGAALLVMAFAVSPFGLPALAGWLVCKLDDLNYSLRGFITG